MSDEQPAEVTATATEQEPQPENEKPTETVDFWKSKAREQEKRAKANAEAAERLTEIETAKSELETQLQQVREELNQAPVKVADSLRSTLAELFEIDEEKRDLYLTASDPAVLLKQAVGISSGKRTDPKPDPTQGGAGGEPVALNSDGLTQALKDKLGIA